MELPKEIYTERLHLIPVSNNHSDFLFNYATNPNVNKFVAWQAPATILDTEKFIACCDEGWANNSDFNWTITKKESGELLGAIEVVPDSYSAKIGYVIDPKYWGQGYATEAGKAISELVLAQPTIFRLWTVCAVENKASARVLEKIGLQLEGVLHKWAMRPNFNSKVPGDCFCYAKVK
jgi:ribosomal-protein-alanine N-acetyltransferase